MSSSVVGSAPIGDSPVDSVESLRHTIRVDPAVDPVCTTSSGPVLENEAPRKGTFKEVLTPLSPRSTERSFADIVSYMDEVPQPMLRDGIPGILFSDQVISSLFEHFKFSLIGRIIGNRGSTQNSSILDAFAHTHLLGSYTVKFIPRGFMVLTLSTEDNYMFFWNKSELSIGSSIRLSKWTPEFKFEEEFPIAPVWVMFPDLPLHLYDRKSIYPIAKILGNLVKIDEITVYGSRGSFSRVCIEIDVLQARQERIWVGCVTIVRRWRSFMRNFPISALIVSL